MAFFIALLLISVALSLIFTEYDSLALNLAAGFQGLAPWKFNEHYFADEPPQAPSTSASWLTRVQRISLAVSSPSNIQLKSFLPFGHHLCRRSNLQALHHAQSASSKLFKVPNLGLLVTSRTRQKTTQIQIKMRLPENLLPKTKIVLHGVQGFVIFLAWAITIAIFTKPGSTDGRIKYFFALVNTIHISGPLRWKTEG